MLRISHELLLFALGAMVLMVAWAPLLIRRAPLSLPILCLALGYGLSFTPWLRVDIHTLGNDKGLEQLNEAVVLIALMGAGLRLDRPFSIAKWGSTWRLLAVVMPVTMVAVYLSARWGGFSAAGSLLLAAALAPTDPVLASDVQTGPPQEGDGGETRFALTAEAGLNDGLAFPFILLAIALQAGTADFGHWIAVEFLGDLLLGIGIGWAVGWVAGYLMFRLPTAKLSDTGDGLVAIGVTLLVYAGTTAIHGNGFVAVFVAALTIRSTCPEDAFHRAMSDFSGQIERLLLMLVILAFGFTLGRGLLSGIGWVDIALGLAVLLLFRPVTAAVAFVGSPIPGLAKVLLGFFGIRGIGTLFYLQYAFNRADFPEQGRIWMVAGFTVLGSILIHGVTSTPLMLRVDALRKARKEGKT